MKTSLNALHKLSVLSAVLLASAVFSTSAQAAILGFDVDFNGSSATYTENFKRFNDSAVGTTGLNWSATGGTGNSGSLVVTETAARNIFYRPEPASDATSTFDFSDPGAVGRTFTATTDFLWSNNTATTTTLVTAGFVSANTDQSALTSSGSLAGSIMRNSGINSGTTVRLRMRNGNGDAQVLDFAQSTMPTGWYRLSYDLTKTGDPNEFDYIVSLFSIGADGTSTPTLFNNGTTDITISGTASNSTLYADPTAFFAYDIRNGGNGITHVDNFNVVPEPGTASLMAIGMLVLSRRQRRRG